MTSSSKLEREVEASRAHVEETVEALRERMSVGDIVNEATRYFKESGGGDVAARLGQQVRDNPLPLLLVGVGLAWLMSGRGQPHFRESYRGGWSGENDFMPGAKRYPASPGGSIERDRYGESFFPEGGSAEDDTSKGESNSSVTESVRETLGDTASSMSNAADTTADWARRRSRAASRWGREAVESAGSWSADAYSQGGGYARSAYRSAERTFMDTLEREPLIFGAIGVAVGAAIGAMLPSTDVEDRYLGDVSARAKEEAEDLARDQLDRGESVLKRASQAAEEEIKAEVKSARNSGASGSSSEDSKVTRLAEESDQVVAERA